VRTLHETTEISVAPDRVWDWLTGLAGSYRQWHPDHVSAEWISGIPNEVGSVLEVVERLGGHTDRLRLELTRIDPQQRYEYRIRGPISALLPRGAFVVEPADGGSRLHATIETRFPRLTRAIFGRRAQQLRRHMQEEGANLKQILESGQPRRQRG
jgi:hypothetical protein